MARSGSIAESWDARAGKFLARSRSSTNCSRSRDASEHLAEAAGQLVLDARLLQVLEGVVRVVLEERHDLLGRCFIDPDLLRHLRDEFFHRRTITDHSGNERVAVHEAMVTPVVLATAEPVVRTRRH